MNLAASPGQDRPAAAREARGVRLQAVDVHKRFERGLVTALAGVSLTVEAGERVAITGPTGCGKSTLLALVALLERPDRGSIVLDGKDGRTIASPEAWRAETVGLVFQFHHLLPHLDVHDNVALALAPRRAGRREVAEVVGHVLERVGLEHRARTRAAYLSGGERQLAALARALVARPRLILADEPTGSVDSATGERVLELLLEWSTEAGATLVMVTHDPLLTRRADRVVHLRDGRLVPT